MTTDQTPATVDPLLAGYGPIVMRLRPRLKTFPVIEGGRRMLADRTPRPALDLKIVRKESQQ